MRKNSLRTVFLTSLLGLFFTGTSSLIILSPALAQAKRVIAETPSERLEKGAGRAVRPVDAGAKSGQIHRGGGANLSDSGDKAGNLDSRDGASSPDGGDKNVTLDGQAVGDQGPDPCESAEPKGMTRDYRKCSADCKTVCFYKTTVDEVNCFACQQGGDDTCKDIGQLDFPHPWCNPGGVCYDSPDMVCAAPFGAVGPRRSKLTCTNCKKRPDMCWQKVKDGTTSLTNCRLGCWNGTCEYVGKYTEKEWDGNDEFLHCYECVTPPPPPTCEDLKWGYDWESDCLNQCNAPGSCQEFEFEVGKKNPEACQDVDTSVKKGNKEDDDEGGTKTRGGGPGGGKKPDGPGSGINDPTKPFGPNETADSTRTKTPCEEVSDGLTGSEITIEPPRSEIERRQRWMKRFQSAVERLKERAEKVNEHLSTQRERVQQLESQLPQAQAELEAAKTAARGAENLGAYGQTRLKELKAAQTRVNNLRSELNQSRAGLQRQEASYNKELTGLRTEAQRALYQADPSAQLAESLSRTDSYYEAYRDHERNRQMKDISDKVFNEKASELQSQIDRGGPDAQKYQTELDNLNRGKADWDAVYDRRQRMLATDINRMQKENGEIGVGPYDLKTLQDHAGQAAMEIQKQINKLRRLKDLMEKAAKNNCPPKGADKVAEEIESKLQDLDAMMKNLENRYTEIENGFPLTEEDKQQVGQTASQIADGSKKTGEVKGRGDFFLESLGEELERTITDPRVAFKKAFWYSVGVVEGVGKAIKGLVETGVGALDLAAETIEGYLHSGDETLFGRDASEALQKFFQATDGNMNLDGIEKLSQGIQSQLLAYEKKLLRTDMDKTVSRAGGQLAGELVVGDAVIGKVIQGTSRLRSLAKGAEVLEKAGDVNVPKSGMSHTPDIDDLVNKADELADGGTGTGLAGKADDIPPTPGETPQKPRGPPPETLAPDAPTNAPPAPAASTLPDFEGVKIPVRPVQGPPKVSNHAASNSDLNFVDSAGNQVELKTGDHLGSGSTSSVYVDKVNPQQVIRVTDTAGPVAEAAKLDEFGRKVIEDVSTQTSSIRIVRQVDRKVIQNQPGSHLNNHVVEIVEKAENGTAKSMIAKQGGQLTETQAQALNKAVKDLNERGYAWLDAKPDNYGFETIPGTDDIRVVVIDPGGIVPMKSPDAARKIQRRIQVPDKEFAEGYNSVGNPKIKDLFAGEEWEKIIKAHGDDIDLNKLGVSSAEDVKFNPSGNVGQPRVGELFNDSL